VRDGPRDGDAVVRRRFLEDVGAVRGELLVALEHEHDLLEIELVLRRLERGGKRGLLTERRAEDPVARAVVAFTDDANAGEGDREANLYVGLRSRRRRRLRGWGSATRGQEHRDNGGDRRQTSPHGEPPRRR